MDAADFRPRPFLHINALKIEKDCHILYQKTEWTFIVKNFAKNLFMKTNKVYNI